jgi:hypothetical protein
VRGIGSVGASRRIAVFFSVLVALGLVAAESAGAVTITSWVGGKASVPQIVTAAGTCPGTVVTINGTGFVNDGGIVSVTIGGVPAGVVVVGADNILYARVGAGATSGPIVVTTKAGSATASPNAIVFPCQATGVATLKPTIDLVAPQSAKGGKKLRLYGSGFVGATSVTVAGSAATYAIPSDNLMYVIVPASAKAGLNTIVVTNAQGSAKVVFQKTG